jgi:uncharacterized protein (UPF0332 family)
VTNTDRGRRERERAAEALSAARVLTAAGLHADAVSRAYYAVFHGAQALLASIGRSARTHDGVRNLVSEHFIRSGRLAPAHGRAFARSAADRGDADYDPDAVFTSEIAAEAITTAESFLAAVDTILATP